MDSTLIFQQAADKGFSILLLCVAVWWLNRGNEKQAKVSRDAMTALNRERSERIGKLETAVDECDKDRSRLWERLLNLAQELRGCETVRPAETVLAERITTTATPPHGN